MRRAKPGPTKPPLRPEAPQPMRCRSTSTTLQAAHGQQARRVQAGEASAHDRNVCRDPAVQTGSLRSGISRGGIPACGIVDVGHCALRMARRWVGRNDVARFRCGGHRRRLRRHVHAAPAAAERASRCGCSRPARASAAPGTGTAIPARAATSRACSTPTSSRPSCEQEWEWTERYATQPEILRYANHVADRFDLRRDIKFETRVTKADVRRGSARLDGRDRQGRSRRRALRRHGDWAACPRPTRRRSPASPTSRARPITPATGRMRASTSPAKTVGVIGTGSSAIQSIPMIAQQAKHVTVFQRTANYTVPAHNAPLDPDYVREVKANYPAMRKRAKIDAGRHRLQDQHGLGHRDARGGAAARIPGALGLWRAGLHGLLLRPAAERRARTRRRRTSCAPRSARS